MVFLFASAVCHADCIDEASKYHQVHSYVLRAIAFQESRMRPWAVNHNNDGSTDFGMMGINSVHLSELDRYGVKPHQLFDPCVSAYVAAWYLRQKMDKYGNTWRAVGAYHSETPQAGAVYAAQIKRILHSWGLGQREPVR
ncbi:lytic transglycosylase domain-containing protein [Dyella flava]|nr:lytic transglycosylase domain-containing protein [Dyella flava]